MDGNEDATSVQGYWHGHPVLMARARIRISRRAAKTLPPASDTAPERTSTVAEEATESSKAAGWTTSAAAQTVGSTTIGSARRKAKAAAGSDAGVVTGGCFAGQNGFPHVKWGGL